MKFGQTDDFPNYFPEVPSYTSDADVAARDARQRENEDEASRARLRTIGGLSLLAVVVVGAGALLYVTQEPGSVRYRRAVKHGQKRCIGRIKYAVLAHGRLKRVGKC